MIIGLHGEAGSGKDFAADFMCEKMSLCEKSSFAKPLYDMVNCLGFNASSDMDREEKESNDNFLGVSIRRMLQTLGTEWGRETINKDIWLKIAQNTINKSHNLIFSDVRFDNEAELIIKNKGVVIEIVSDNNLHSTTQTEHKSEQGINRDYIFTTIKNDYTDNFNTLLANFLIDFDMYERLVLQYRVTPHSLLERELHYYKELFMKGYEND